MGRKRSFASIEQLPSKRWRVRYTGPDGAIHKAPHTFAAKIDAEAWAIAERRRIDQDRWEATDDDRDVILGTNNLGGNPPRVEP